jgi:hypothetical protein
MVETAYIAFVFVATLIGVFLGAILHFWRAHATYFPEDLDLGENINILTRDNYLVEKYVANAEWNEAGYWDGDSVRNLAYYAITGALGPIIIGVALWGERALVVDTTCQVLTAAGLTPPLCP